MTKFIITNMKPADGAKNTLATFDLLLRDLGIKLRNITLSRPPHVPAPETRLYFPRQRRERNSAYYLCPGELRTSIGAAACAAYTAMTGKPAVFIEQEAPEEVDGAPDSGLRKLLCAGGEEALEKAGI